MGSRTRRIAPATGDYIADGRGGYETTRTAETQAYLAVAAARDRWVGAGTLGSRLSEFSRAKSLVGRTPAELREVLLEALAPLVRAGRLRDVSVRIERERGRVVSEITATDIATGARLDLSALAPSTL